MTDKQIIIDGVDVSKCIYFQQEDDEYTCGAEECNGAIVGCRACDNCYYKQLKRKEQECEELKEKLRDYMDKYLHELAVGKIDIICKLKQTLTEIKEIAKGIAKSKYDSYPYGGDVETWEAQRAKQILQKISEVENG